MRTSTIATRERKKESSFRRLQVETDHLLQVGKKPGCKAFLTRGLRALTRLAEELHETALADAVGAVTDYAVLLSALGKPEALIELERDDPLVQARLWGLEVRKRLLDAEGGPLSGQEAAKLLGITRQAIDKRRRTGRLLGLHIGRRGYAYPSWQFSDEGVLPGLEEALHDLRNHDSWMQLGFMLSGNICLDGKVPLEELRRGNVAAVCRAARLYGEQGGV